MRIVTDKDDEVEEELEEDVVLLLWFIAYERQKLVGRLGLN